jgi:hypothetical protein
MLLDKHDKYGDIVNLYSYETNLMSYEIFTVGIMHRNELLNFIIIFGVHISMVI